MTGRHTRRERRDDDATPPIIAAAAAWLAAGWAAPSPLEHEPTPSA